MLADLLVEDETIRIVQVVVVPKEKTVLWYEVRNEMPEVQPVQRIGPADTERGREVRDPATTVIVDSHRPDAGKQMIWTPAPELERREDLPSPNLIAIQPVAPAPPRKAFQPPPEILQPLSKTVDVPEPTVRVEVAANELSKLQLPAAIHQAAAPSKPRPRAFVPPSAPAVVPSPDATILDAPPVIGVPSGESTVTAITAAIVSAQPQPEIDQPIPSGSREGRFSIAPQHGPPSSGSSTGDGFVIPNLRVKGQSATPSSPSIPQPPDIAVEQTKHVFEFRTPVPLGTTSAPLRPFSRRLPDLVERRFTGRLVYTFLVPSPPLPEYADDWVIWFSDPSEHPEEMAKIRGPVPVRKRLHLTAGPMIGNNVPDGRVCLAASIQADGQVEQVTVLQSPHPGLGRAAAEDFKRWDFQPAIRNGVAVTVDVVIEIPLRAQPLLASQ